MQAWEKLNVTQEDESWLRRIFRKRVKFYADANVEPEVIEALRNRRVNIVTAATFGYQKRSDEDHYALAYKEKRMLLTRDRDYWDNRRFPLDQTRGVLILGPDLRDGERLASAMEFIIYGVVPFADNWMKTKLEVNADTVKVISRDRETGMVTTKYYRLSADGYWYQRINSEEV